MLELFGSSCYFEISILHILKCYCKYVCGKSYYKYMDFKLYYFSSCFLLIKYLHTQLYQNYFKHIHVCKQLNSWISNLVCDQEYVRNFKMHCGRWCHDIIITMATQHPWLMVQVAAAIAPLPAQGLISLTIKPAFLSCPNHPVSVLS
jgi:hypothetical protein